MTKGTGTDLRLVRAQRILATNGLSAFVSLAGQANDIIAIQAPISQLHALQSLAPELKQAGFRYVTLELDTEASRESR